MIKLGAAADMRPGSSRQLGDLKRRDGAGTAGPPLRATEAEFYEAKCDYLGGRVTELETALQALVSRYGDLNGQPFDLPGDHPVAVARTLLRKSKSARA